MLPLTYVMHAPGVTRNLYQAWYWGISGITTKIEITWKYSCWAHHETIWELWAYVLYLMCISWKPEKLLMLININYWFPFSGLFFQRENDSECSQEMLNDYFVE